MAAKRVGKRPRQDGESLYQRALQLARQDLARHKREILVLLRKAAELQSPSAQHALATWYLFGVGVRKNFKKAAELEARAARANVAEAAFNLAVSCETGRGVERNAREALRLYKRAASLGDDDAPYEVGRMYRYGIGIRADERAAKLWYARARKAGVAEALEDAKRGRLRTPGSRKR
jgi:TPR repeat protein